MDERVRQTLEALKRNKFNVRLVENADMAKSMVSDIIPKEAIVGIGNSATVRQIGVLPELESKGTKIINPFKKEIRETQELFQQMARETFGADVFLTGSNAITLDGKIVNIDMAGNRVAGMVFGAKTVVLIIGTNKIVENVDEALHRIKHLITPFHAASKGRKTPCAVSGECNDCNADERLCNVILILEKKPLWTDIYIVLIDEDLGLAWNPSWPEERINRIKAEYQTVTEPTPVYLKH